MKIFYNILSRELQDIMTRNPSAPRESPPHMHSMLTVKKRKPFFLSLHPLLLFNPHPERGSYLISTVPKWPRFFHFSLLPPTPSLWPDGLTMTLPSLFLQLLPRQPIQYGVTVNLLWSHMDHMLCCWDTCPSRQLDPWVQSTDFTRFPDKYHRIRFVSLFAFDLVCCPDGLS